MNDRARKSTLPDRTPGGRASTIFLLIILAAAAALRISYLREVEHAPDFASPTADAAYHDYWARGIVTGNWTPPRGEPDPRISSSAFARPPGYPYFLAAIYAWGGPDLVRPRAVQVALGLGSVFLAFLLAGTLFGRTAAVATGALAAVTWGLIYYEGELQEPALAVFLLLAAANALLACARRPSFAGAALGGLFLGLSALVRPNALVIVPVAAAWLAWTARPAKRRAVLAALLLAGAAAAIAPATLRNLLVAKDPVLIAANGGINLYAGNNAASDGVSARLPILREIGIAEGWSWFRFGTIVEGLGRKLGRRLTYSQASSAFERMALDYAAAHPGATVRLVARKALLFWGPIEVSNNKVDELDRGASRTLRHLPGFPIALSLALLGLVLWIWRARRGHVEAKERAGVVLLLLLVAVYFLSFLPFLVAGRFRVPIVPFLLVLAGFGVAEITRHIRARNLGAAAACLGVLAATSALAHARFVPYAVDAAWWHTDRGAAYQRRGMLTEAIAEYWQALTAKPNYLDARLALGGALAKSGSADDGVRQFREAIRVAPDRAEPRFRLANLLIDMGRTADAAAELREGLRIAPGDAEAQYNLGYVSQLAGRLDEAIPAYGEAVRLQPNWVEAHTNLGIALTDAGRLDEAETELRHALTINPRFPIAHLGLGNVLLAKGRSDEAFAEYQAAIAAEPNLAAAHAGAAKVLLAKGLADDAVREYKEALRTAPNDVTAQRGLADALAAAGRDSTTTSRPPSR